jgi:hypothetical protein
MSRLPDPKKYWTEYVNKYRFQAHESQTITNGLMSSNHVILDFYGNANSDSWRVGKVVGTVECLWRIRLDSWDEVFPIFAYMPEFSGQDFSWVPKRGKYCGISQRLNSGRLVGQELLFQRDLGSSRVSADLLKVEFTGDFPEGCLVFGLKDPNDYSWAYSDLCFGPEHWNRERLLDLHQNIPFPVSFLPHINSGIQGGFSQRNMDTNKSRTPHLEQISQHVTETGFQVFRTQWVKKTETICPLVRFVASGVLTSLDRELTQLLVTESIFNSLIGECVHAL